MNWIVILVTGVTVVWGFGIALAKAAAKADQENEREKVCTRS